VAFFEWSLAIFKLGGQDVCFLGNNRLKAVEHAIDTERDPGPLLN